METIKQQLPEIKAFVLAVLDSLLVLLMGLVGFVLVPTVFALVGFVLGFIYGTVGLVHAIVLAFGESK